MITLIEPMDRGKPSHYIINNAKGALNTSYNNIEDWEESIVVDSILYGKHNIESGEIEDLTNYTIVNELDIMGGESKANNIGKIL